MTLLYAALVSSLCLFMFLTPASAASKCIVCSTESLTDPCITMSQSDLANTYSQPCSTDDDICEHQYHYASDNPSSLRTVSRICAIHPSTNSHINECYRVDSKPEYEICRCDSDNCFLSP